MLSANEIIAQVLSFFLLLFFEDAHFFFRVASKSQKQKEEPDSEKMSKRLEAKLRPSDSVYHKLCFMAPVSCCLARVIFLDPKLSKKVEHVPVGLLHPETRLVFLASLLNL